MPKVQTPFKLQHQSINAPTSIRTIDATAAQHAIDEEIAESIVLHEALIRNLKTRRNAYSTTSILPSEILERIFLVAKDGSPSYGTPKEASWLNVAGVCQEWRSNALASPRMWSSIDISKPDCALEFLKRAKSTPLRISCKTSLLVITAANADMIKSIMAEISYIQKISICTTSQNEIRQLFNTAAASAPLLEHLQLATLTLSSAMDLFPLHVKYPEMPSLRRLDLGEVNISEFPPLPHLTHLAISLDSSSSMRPSSLLSSLRHSPKLEEINVTGLVKDKPADSPPRVKLPNLTRITIGSFDLEA